MSTCPEPRTRLDLLEARQAVQELITRYCLGMDACDRDMVLSCFTEDVQFRCQDRSWGRGREQLWRLLAGQLAGMRPSWHVAVGPAVVDGKAGSDRIRSSHYGYVETGIDDALVVAGITYHHRLRREAGSWLIDKRALDFWYFGRADEIRTHYRSRDRVWWRPPAPPTYPRSFSGFVGFEQTDWGQPDRVPL